MDAKKRRALTAAGFRAGNAEDFLGLTDEERHLVDLRLQVSRAIRRLREARRMTQQELADRLGSSQSRVAKIEIGVGVSLDLMFRGLFAVGGRLADLGASGNVSAARPGTVPARSSRSGTKPRKRGEVPATR